MLGDTEAHVATTDLESDYEILGELGRGATAVVYRARDRALGREVAIKVIRPKYVDDDETVARLSREARTVAQLQHPNIVTLYAVRRVRDGGLALVMQLVPGRTLRDILNERGACTFGWVDRVLRDVGAALAHAHQRGIVHRDVKPENIFIDESTGQALLSDFGVARSLEPDSQLTATGTAIGTPSYMSPEQIDGTELDGRSDLYSLGLVGWEMLTGRRPWEGEGLYSVIYKQKREELPPIEAFRPDAPDRLMYVVEGATRKDPADRWSNAGEMLERTSTISPEGGWSRWHAERRKRRRATVYTAARERGDSVLSAALETMRFRRDGSTPNVAVDASDAAVVATERRATPVGSTAPDIAAAYASAVEDEKPRRSMWAMLVVTAVIVAAIAGSVRVMRGRSAPIVDPQAPTTFADNGGVEVPLTRPPTVAVPSALTPNATDSAAVREAPAPPADTTSKRTAPAETIQPRDGAPAAADARVAGRETGTAISRPPAVVIPPRTASGTAATSGDASRPTAGGTPLPPPSAAAMSASVVSASTTPSTPSPSRDSSPVAAPVSGSAVSFPPERGIVAAGGRHSCELNASGAASCWGANDQGQLGDGTREDRTGPVVVAGDLSFTQLSAGASHTCAVSRDGDAYCWGNNERGQLGDATNLERDTPIRVGASGPFKVVRAGFSHSCALSRAGEISCWGSNAYGQLGTGVGLTSARPAEVAGGLRYGALAVGWNHSCGISLAGDLYCWGSNNTGQLGDGTRDDRRVPTRAVTSTRFISVAAGTQHTCAVSTTGDLYCWGRNNYGQLATGAGDRAQPTRVEAEGSFSTVTAGAVHSCARTTAGQVYCWGRNNYGQLGDGTTVDRPTPVRVVGLPAVAVVHATGAHTCAATAAGDSYCWGYNVEGQLGDGSRNHRSRPARVSSPSR